MDIPRQNITLPAIGITSAISSLPPKNRMGQGNSKNRNLIKKQ